MKNCALLLAAASVAGLLGLGGCAQRGCVLRSYDTAPTINMPGVGVPKGELAANAIPGRLDHLAYDPVTNRLYVAALEQGSLEVIDLKTRKRIVRVEGLKKPQGIAVVRMDGTRTSREGWVVVATGGDGMVRAFDARSLEQVREAYAGENADNVRFDGLGRIYVGTGGNTGPGALAVFDATTLDRVGTIDLPLRPESFQLADDGVRIFANTPGGKTADNDGSVVVVDRTTNRVIANWTIAGAARNFPLAYDGLHERLFFACRKPAVAYCIDARSGAVLSKSDCVADSDDIFYDRERSRLYVIGGGRRSADPATDHAPTPGADAAMDAFEVGADGAIERVWSAPTAPHARTGLFVGPLRAVFVVAPPHDGKDSSVLEIRPIR